jgi:hypothetical protein
MFLDVIHYGQLWVKHTHTKRQAIKVVDTLLGDDEVVSLRGHCPASNCGNAEGDGDESVEDHDGKWLFIWVDKVIVQGKEEDGKLMMMKERRRGRGVCSRRRERPAGIIRALLTVNDCCPLTPRLLLLSLFAPPFLFTSVLLLVFSVLRLFFLYPSLPPSSSLFLVSFHSFSALISLDCCFDPLASVIFSVLLNTDGLYFFLHWLYLIHILYISKKTGEE